MTRGARGRSALSGARGREVLDGPRTREVLEGGRSRQVLLGPRGRTAGGVSYPDVFDEAVLWLDSKYSVSGEPRVINQGAGDTTGVSGAVIYDGAARLPGAAGNYLSVPDEAALDITGDLEVLVRLSLSDWTPSNPTYPIGKWGSAGNNSWLLEVRSNGALRFYWSTDGTVVNNATSAANGFIDGGTYWLRIRFDVDNGASGRTATFDYAPDDRDEPGSWTTLSAITSAGVTSIHSGTVGVAIGSEDGGGFGNIVGDIYRAIVRDGIDGTTVLDVDLANVPNFTGPTFEATTGQTVTVNTTATDFGAPSGLDAKYGSVLGAYVYDGAFVSTGVASNYMTTPDAAALDVTGDIEFVIRARMDDWSPAAFTHLITKYASAGQRSWGCGIQLSGGNTNFQIYVSADGTNSTVTVPQMANGVLVDGETYWLKFTLDVDNGSSQRVGRIYYAADQSTEPSSWTLGGTATTAGATSIYAGTSPVYILNENGSNTPGVGSVHRAVVRDGIDGTTVLDVDLANVADYATSFTATTGQTVTVNSTSSDTNDPLLLTHTGENYAHCPPDAGNVFDFPQNDAHSGMDEICLVMHSRRPDWDLVAWDSFAATSLSGDYVQGAWSYGVVGAGGSPDGAPVFFYFDGVARSWACNALFPFADNEWGWHSVTFARTTGGDVTVRFWYSYDGENWTQLGTDRVSSGIGTLNTSTRPLRFGGKATLASSAIGQDVKYFAIYDGVGNHSGPALGEKVFEFNAATDIVDSSATSIVSSNGETGSILRATSGRKTALVTRPVWLFGTDDYLEVADNALLDFDADDDFTLMAVVRKWPSQVGNSVIMGKFEGVPLLGYRLQFIASGATLYAVLGDGATTSESSVGVTSNAGDIQTLVLVRDIAAGEYEGYVDGVELVPRTGIGGTGVLTNSAALALGGKGAFVDGEFCAFAVWRRRLTTDEIAEINNYYGTV